MTMGIIKHHDMSHACSQWTIGSPSSTNCMLATPAAIALVNPD
jgi:hypothetical protein